ncbi:unnamed protein product [Paramecium primaurelia]|uniref:Uncharacterized protein n=1 Tax=Paramecium primaurelia TaxID=5886 RepID=A0A8S1KGW1_PARPR|nr:unnamed protein product [Paramecium primaurelia]
MEKITLSPIHLLKNKGDMSPKSNDDNILSEQKKIWQNKQSPLKKNSNQGDQRQKALLQCDFILLTDKLHLWNRYLISKFEKIDSISHS